MVRPGGRDKKSSGRGPPAALAAARGTARGEPAGGLRTAAQFRARASLFRGLGAKICPFLIAILSAQNERNAKPITYIIQSFTLVSSTRTVASDACGRRSARREGRPVS